MTNTINPIDSKTALELLSCTGPEVYRLLHRAHETRMICRTSTIKLCGILNAKSGKCTEDCRFCAQSVHNDVENVACYDLVNEEKILEAAETAHNNGANRLGIVTSGLSIEKEEEIETIASAVAKIAAEKQINPCASLGNISRKTMLRLKEAGLTRYHCNLETAESFYPNICTTRPWRDAWNTIKTARELGLYTCSGGLFGLGETLAQRVELLASIAELDVDSVPLNFFYPVPGTRVNNPYPLTPLDCLKIIAVARLMLPNKEIRVCGGREHHLGDLQSWVLISGADGLMVGGYLTAKGRNVKEDLIMIRNAGFEIESYEH